MIITIIWVKHTVLLLLLILVLHLEEQLAILHGDSALHHKVLRRVGVVLRALNLIGVTAVAIVVLDSLLRLEKISENLVENLDVKVNTGRVETLDPYQAPCQDVYTQLIAEGGLSHILV
jgi:hypothetical protein